MPLCDEDIFFALSTCPIRCARSPIYRAANVLVALACNAVHVLGGLKLQLLPQSFPSAVARPLLAGGEAKSRRDLSRQSATGCKQETFNVSDVDVVFSQSK